MNDTELKLSRGTLSAVTLDEYGTLGGRYSADGKPCFEMVGRDRQNAELTRMLVASEDMFEALNEMLTDSKLQLMLGGNPNHVERVIAKAHAALSKAKGQKPNGEG